ncbi:hypothetical protein AAF712_007641 [Marasmius tenuissimus]|uniref:Uncharacterized protein n=1 Tax=Marasmius tenuissimus TaxID=585030 RepID=A0ABR2ZYD7_9AGAR
MRNVIDLQVVETKRRISSPGYRKRLMAVYGPHVVNNPRMRERFTHIHMLVGLGRCVEEQLFTAKPKGIVDHHSWMQRPLSKKHLDYASHDAYLISQLLATFEKRGLTNNSDIVLQSNRYISIWNDKQPRKGDCYRSNPFFPLGIFDYRDDSDEVSARCDGCKRNLSAASFPSVGLDVSGTYCHICDLIPKWKENQRYLDNVRGRK